MDPEIRFQVMWGGANVFGVRFSAWNGAFGGSTDILLPIGSLSDAAAKLDGFPRDPSDSRELVFGPFNEGSQGEIVRVRFFCRDSAGHAMIRANMESEPDETGSTQSVVLSASVEASAVDLFVAQLRGLETWQNHAAILRINQREPVNAIGTHESYNWLCTRDHDLGDILRGCPQAVLGKFVAVTSFDSGPLALSDEEKAFGWDVRNHIAYSPQVVDVAKLPHELYDEWYVSPGPIDLGHLSPQGKNIFESSVGEGELFTFVNFGGFALHRTEDQTLVDLFWKQMNVIRPELYIADGDFLTIACANRELFSEILQTLGACR
ncbi:MAG: hypothetical protein WBQ94_01890 [Terracidiphilus sp.]